MPYFCNPLNIPYRYQFNEKEDGSICVSREAADPSIVRFRGRYFIFPSMTCGFLVSDDLASWTLHPLKNLPGYDYAPDAEVVGGKLVLCASSHAYGRFYRTDDPFSDTFETVGFPFPFWDPCLFADDDGRVYLYWGCGAGTPVNGIELDADTLQPAGETKELIFMDDALKGFERRGEDHSEKRRPDAEVEALKKSPEFQALSGAMKAAALGFLSGKPYNEGAWMTKHEGRYYLQYATPGSQYNIYCDAVYESSSPLGPFTLADSNPLSYKGGGFIPGAGHGSTLIDGEKGCWHVSTMRISVNHNFERRLGLWKAGFDEDGVFYCDQRYGDFPLDVSSKPFDPPDFLLLSHGKTARASSGTGAQNALDENVQTWWKAGSPDPGEWIEADLGKACDVRAVQVNFADDALSLPLPEGAALIGALHQRRWIDERQQFTRWKLEGSLDGREYFVIEDKSQANTDLPHDLVVREEGISARYIRLTVYELPYRQACCVSGLRVFGHEDGLLPSSPTDVRAVRSSEIDIGVSWKSDAQIHNVLWGYRPDKLYHSRMVFGTSASIGGLVRGQEIHLRVDALNGSGITQGSVIRV